MDELPYHDILYNDAPLGPYPMHLLRRVEKPTNLIPGPALVDLQSHINL